MRTISVDQVVAGNIRYWRIAAGMTQAQLGALTGLTAPNMSALEASAEDGKERRRFDAQSLAGFALALGVPVLALLLPPPDDGVAVRYVVEMTGLKDSPAIDVKGLLLLVLPDTGDDSPVMDAYRDRLRSVVSSYLDPDWLEDVNYWLRDLTTAEERAERAEALRAAAAGLERAAAENLRLAELITRPDAAP